jgi:hypothetical protein
LVFYREGILLRLPAAAVAPAKSGHSITTKVTSTAVEELIATVRVCGICPSTQVGSGGPSPKSSRSKSRRT